MRLYGIGLVRLIVLALVSLQFLSACILVPVEDVGRRGDRGWHSDDREHHEEQGRRR